MVAESKSVLITGCSPGGIGHAIALEFRSKGSWVLLENRNELTPYAGFRVFATARSLA
ncbi:hypothetical protein V8E51_017663 [Hyaloscypha variabilis]